MSILIGQINLYILIYILIYPFNANHVWLNKVEQKECDKHAFVENALQVQIWKFWIVCWIMAVQHVLGGNLHSCMNKAPISNQWNCE